MSAVLSTTKKPESEPKARIPVRSIHHISYRCYDPEETRRYYEDFLGLEFSAAMPTTVEIDGAPVECLQMLFRMAKGDFISFYHVPGDERRDIYEPLKSLDLHLGTKVSSKADWQRWVDRFTKAGIPFEGPLHHEFIESIYFTDPNGLVLEITYEVDQHEEILRAEKAHLKSALASWTAKTSGVKSDRRKNSATT